MKTQKHNEGDLAELAVKIEKNVVEDFHKMAEYSGLPLEELVVVALKRFRSSHADYMDIKLDYP
jgi:fructose-1,6-bisphosphatase/sedoheptulose 1,7-bisphosphatase-like protein